MGALSPTHWLIIIAVLVLLFGARRLPDAARGLGRSARILKAELASNGADSAGARTSNPDTAPPTDGDATAEHHS